MSNNFTHLSLSYSQFIETSIANSLQIYYSTRSSGTMLELLSVGADHVFMTLASGDNLTDFNENYLSDAVETNSHEDAGALGLALINRVNPITGGVNSKILAKSRGDFSPTPTMKLNETSVDEETRVETDSDNNLQIRGPVISDEGSFRDDFNGASLFTDLTGTLNFTNGSITVTGVSSLFTEELNRDHHIKIAADTNDKLIRVKRIISDTELELDSEYQGSTASAVSHKSNWLMSFSGTGANITVSINGSEVAKSKTHIPYIYENMYLFAGITNTSAVGVSTSVVINEIAVSNDDQLQVANDYRGSPISTVSSDEVKYIQSTISTNSNAADQLLISYTVPSGYTFLLVGWTISNNGASSAAPIKIGRNSLTENTSSTGSPGGELYEVFDLTANLSVPQRYNESIPALIGKSGDIIKVAVTPSTHANTKWRTVLRFVLR